MTNYYKYLPTSTEDENWGLYVLNVGCNCIHKHEDYPSPNHPAHHYFSWEKGRILDEYQLIYISRGEGIFESASCKEQIVKEGSALFLFPGEWHRFKPATQTGWNEFWVGCNGSIIKNLVNQRFLNQQEAVVNIGVDETVVHLLTDIVEKTKKEKTGYQPLIAGILLHLLGHIYSLTKQHRFEPKDMTESLINKARIILRTNIDVDLSMEKVADELNVSYAWFRKAFKNYTGIAPHQYLLQLKIEKAKMLLTDQTKSIKEVAFSLNFESAFYFSKLFKEKTGVSPEIFRKNMQR